MNFSERTGLRTGDTCRVKGNIGTKKDPFYVDVEGIIKEIRQNGCIVTLNENPDGFPKTELTLFIRKGILLRPRRDRRETLPEMAEYICNQLCKHWGSKESEERKEAFCRKCRLSGYLDQIADDY